MEEEEIGMGEERGEPREHADIQEDATHSQPLESVPDADQEHVASHAHGAPPGVATEAASGAGAAGAEAEAGTSSGEVPSQSPPSTASPHVDWGSVAEAREELRGRPSLPVVVSKSSQLEAEALDLELTGMLQEQLKRVFSLLRPSAMSSLTPELDAIFRCVIFSYSVWQNKPTPGAMFQNLIYSNASGASMRPTPLTQRQRGLHALLYVILPYAWTRAGTSLGSWGWGSSQEGGWRKRAWSAYVGTESALRHIALINFLLFIANGRYRNTVDRVIGARFMHIDPGMMRALSLDYVGYFLAWQGFTNLLAFLHPIVSSNAGGVRRRIIRAAGMGARPTNQPMPPGVCHECHASPANSPHVPGGCGHVHCYYCLKANMMAQPGEYRCKGCGAVASRCVPATGVQVRAGAEQPQQQSSPPG